jgi:SH3-like domain-containing protein
MKFGRIGILAAALLAGGFPIAWPNAGMAEPLAPGWVSALCVNVRDGPSTKAKIIGHLFKGDSLEVLSSQTSSSSSWHRVRDGAGYIEGWVSAVYVSREKIRSDFVVPESYKEPRTPSVDTTVTAAFVGVQACKNCHAGAHDRQYAKWLSHFHSDAYQTLGKSYALAFAKKRGIDSPTSDWRCVKCHVTAYGVGPDRKAAGYSDSEGVTCEACHGPGGAYLAIHDKRNADPKALQAAGFRIFRNLQQRDSFCRSCHNELSPTYKPFNVELFSEAIRHWDKETEVAYSQQLTAQAQAIPASTAIGGASVPAISPAPPVPSATPTPTPAPTPATPTPTPTPTAAPAASPSPSAAPRVDVLSPATIPGGEPGPNEVTLNKDRDATRGAILFTHRKHWKYVEKGELAVNCLICHHTNKPSDRMDDCGKCHKTEATVKTPDRERAFHNSCRTCHKEQQAGPITCTACHGS